MVIFSIENIKRYFGLFPVLKETIDILQGMQEYLPGRYQCKSGYFMIQEGTASKKDSDSLFEAHKEYIDVQILLDGEEYVSWRNTGTLACCSDPSEETVHYEGKGKTIHMCKGDCYVFFPEDAHKACLCEERPLWYRKIVVKCPLASFSLLKQ